MTYSEENEHSIQGILNHNMKEKLKELNLSILSFQGERAIFRYLKDIHTAEEQSYLNGLRDSKV